MHKGVSITGCFMLESYSCGYAEFYGKDYRGGQEGVNFKNKISTQVKTY
jgi:hypothetical protein